MYLREVYILVSLNVFFLKKNIVGDTKAIWFITELDIVYVLYLYFYTYLPTYCYMCIVTVSELQHLSSFLKT